MSQQAMLAETITAMKKAMARHDDASDSDTSIKKQTNRGNKLKRKAKFVSEGRLDQAGGPRTYKREINFNGYSRHVISRVPLWVDPDGDTVDDADDDSTLDVEPAEEDSYSGIHIDKILRPLTSAAELDKHPAMSVPYKSKALETMVQNAQDMVFQEQSSLWRMQDILTAFRGDRPFAPCGIFETENDHLLLRHVEPEAFVKNSTSSKIDSVPSSANVNWDSLSDPRLVAGLEDAVKHGAAEATKEAQLVEKMEGIETHDAAYGSTPRTKDEMMMDALDSATTNVNRMTEESMGIRGPASDESANAEEGKQIQSSKDQIPTTDGNTLDHLPEADALTDGNGQATASHETVQTSDSAVPEQANGTSDQAQPNTAPTDATIPSPQTNGPVSPSLLPQTHRMTTRARAQATNTDSEASPTPLHLQSTRNPRIHPFFLPPPSSLPDRNAGLRPDLADDLRRTLTSYVQKQEEVVRQCSELLDGLRKALRSRKEVWAWCRAEAHVGEMSDGEDWIDEEEWGLDGPLRKGEDVDNGDEVDDWGMVGAGNVPGMATGGNLAAAAGRGGGREFMTRDGAAKKTRTNNRRAAAAAAAVAAAG